MKLFPETPAEKRGFAWRSPIEAALIVAGLGFYAAPSITPALQALTAPLRDVPPAYPEYAIGNRTAGLETVETPESGSVKFFMGRRESIEFDLRLGLIFDHEAGRMYDFRYADAQPPADLLAAYNSLKTQFCQRHKGDVAIPDERRAALCPSPPVADPLKDGPP